MGLISNNSKSKLNREFIDIQKNYKNIKLNSEENKYLIDGFGKERINFFINRPIKKKA